MIKYKCNGYGIEIILNEESYTSKCSALDLESIEFHENYLGKRIKRGLFQTKNNLLINSDLNGSMNIYRKVFGDVDFSNLLSNKNCVIQLNRVNSIKEFL